MQAEIQEAPSTASPMPEHSPPAKSRAVSERIARSPLAQKRVDELLGATVDDGELLCSLVRSMTEAAYRRETYLARAHAMAAREVLIECLRNTGEAQEIAGAQKLEAAREAVASS